MPPFGQTSEHILIALTFSYAKLKKLINSRQLNESWRINLRLNKHFPLIRLIPKLIKVGTQAQERAKVSMEMLLEKITKLKTIVHMFMYFWKLLNFGKHCDIILQFIEQRKHDKIIPCK